MATTLHVRPFRQVGSFHFIIPAIITTHSALMPVEVLKHEATWLDVTGALDETSHSFTLGCRSSPMDGLAAAAAEVRGLRDGFGIDSLIYGKPICSTGITRSGPIC